MGKRQGSLPERSPAEDAGACTDDSAYTPQGKTQVFIHLNSFKKSQD
jgi:hypothetical protein